MKKRLVTLALAAVMALLPVLAVAEEAAFDASGLIDWFNESNTWMTVANGHWSANPEDQITDEELAKAFSMAVKQQNAVHWTPLVLHCCEGRGGAAQADRRRVGRPQRYGDRRHRDHPCSG